MQRTLKVKVKVLRGAQEEILESTATPEWFGDGRVSGNQPGYMCMIMWCRSYTEIAHSSLKTLAEIDVIIESAEVFAVVLYEDVDQCPSARPNL
jgi:hypothetical protein